MATPLDNIIPLSGNALVDGLVQGSAWQLTSANRVITYSLSLNDTANGGPWTTALSTALRQAFDTWANVANVTFLEEGSGSIYTQSVADVAVTLTGSELQTSVGAVGLGVFPSPNFADQLQSALGYSRSEYPRPEGDVFLDNDYSAYQYLGIGGAGLDFMIHEIGHALGLKHPNDDGGNARPTFAQLDISSYDDVRYTIMSNNDSAHYSLNSSGHPATPMLLDVLAFQSLYGANTSYHSGDDTYVVLNDLAGKTIWDAGGIDTIDASGLGFGITIDIRAGHAVQNGGLGTWIAYGTTIENVIGTKHGDVVYGNDADNVIDEARSQGYTHTLNGGKGNDIYIIGNPNDSVVEQSNEGIDTVRVDSIFSSGTYVLADNVENLAMSGTANLGATGNSLDNVITGNSGKNLLVGGAGSDYLDGGPGVDTLRGGQGNDTYVVSDATNLPATYISAYGDAGDYITQGQSYVYGTDDGTFSISLSDFTSDGLLTPYPCIFSVVHRAAFPTWIFQRADSGRT